ncbi:MAG: hypothetical protein D3926_17015 [Desulfobacteraceae bacterium]|nr:MAG: hypothetical protein D3926_17015 [Desulfobacteraceae bacterium]
MGDHAMIFAQKKPICFVILILGMLFMSVTAVHAISIMPSATRVEVGQPVNFTITASPSPNSQMIYCPIEMDFDEGQGFVEVGLFLEFVTVFNISHTFTRAGTYTVRVRGGDDCDAMPPRSAQTTIVVTAPGTLAVTATPSVVTTNQPVNFRVQVNMVSDISCPIFIDYGDGTPGQELGRTNNDRVFNATHSYSYPGNYRVTVRSTPNCPALDDVQASTTVRVNISPGTMGITASTSRAYVNEPVSFTIQVQMDTSEVPCPVNIDYGDGSGFQELGRVSRDTTLHATHAYARPGMYQVRVRSAGSCPALATAQASANVRIQNFIIDRIQVYFDNNRPEITLNRNDPAPGLFVKINFSGAGLLKAYWEVDGIRKHHVIDHLGGGFQKVYTYPNVPPLPTYTPGSHRVRFVITNPPMEIQFPQGLYFVTAHEPDKLATLLLNTPEDKAILAFEPLTFTWQTVDQAPLYFLRIFEKNTDKDAVADQMIFSAYTGKGTYQLRPEVMNSRLQPGNTYFWDVQGFDSEKKRVAQSGQRRFAFDGKTAFVPGQILLAIHPSTATQGILEALTRDHGLTVLENFMLETLGLEVFIVHTDQDVDVKIMTLKKVPDVELAQPNYIFQTLAEPMNNLQTIRKMIDFEALHKRYTGKGVQVAVVDTGVDKGHADLAGAVVLSENFIRQSRYKIEVHGTAVAGLAGSRANRSGISGCAPESNIFALRACEQLSESKPEGRCYSSSMVKAIDTALVKGADIINMSLGALVDDPIMSRLIETGVEQQVIFVAPVGNNVHAQTVYFPASHPGVIAVAGRTEEKKLFPNETVAAMADILAPSENVFAPIPGNSHNFMNGTSLSSALVSGILALAREKDSALSKETLPEFDGDLGKWINTIFE